MTEEIAHEIGLPANVIQNLKRNFKRCCCKESILSEKVKLLISRITEDQTADLKAARPDWIMVS